MLAFMGVGQTELIILGGMCFLLVVVGAIALVVILIAKSGTIGCRKCRASNPKHARFCQQCGEPL
jgi:hypothetical protein